MGRELETIVEEARRTRRPVSRGMWLAALVLGTIGLVGFVLLLLAEPDASGAPPAAASRGRLGFGAGVVVGAVAGIAIGYALARRRSAEGAHSSGSGPGHSSRNMP